MSKEAMKLALEALEAHADIGIKSDKAITTLREALAEQPAPMIRGDIRDGLVDDEPVQQEPVAWRYLTKYKDQSVWTYCAFEPTSREIWEALYTSPPAQKENT